ncbi:2,4-dihydroxyhept-2-ene-1,7-dioic acid aldolase [Candidatus Uabimicrobium amorphum]|uniref:4-hydroxy-tetrahydrodipicolinate synthase n=1 Tax=Uabimicrobium amorphum TaxID=2596890 RepID=A0A5S9ITX9_UABAM|nr:2,4-dihydroxyhept-2-ene-1,7-dioic acid aldolase [Candidatus Uabimicrobium amorphum]BBM87566.1 4-hydroxy-tetrahydrodipicolinate synthase [Candidatus Uabimicrobium amorphum]
MNNFKGSIVPVVTPFKDGKVDYDSFSQLIEWQIASGSHGISVTGTTGEPSSLSIEERKRVMKTACDVINKRVPFIPGTGSANHRETLELSKYAQIIGADAVMIIAPYYLRPSQEGLFTHFSTVAASIDLPIILYNIPGRTAVNIAIDTVARLKEKHEHIIGVKESNKDFEHINRLLQRMGRDFAVYSGIELLCFPILAIGGAGYISATGNLMPHKVADLYNFVCGGEWQKAQDLHFEMMTLNDAIFLEINPVPVKTILGMMGKISPEVRLPLTAVSEENYHKLHKIAVDYQLIAKA